MNSEDLRELALAARAVAERVRMRASLVEDYTLEQALTAVEEAFDDFADRLDL